MVTGHTEGYNTRLFQSGKVRRAVHMARFKWIAEQLRSFGADGYKMVEIGCFDGRVLQYCPPPIEYFGFDANWEGGLDDAKANYGDKPNWRFELSATPDDLKQFSDNSFDVAISLETMEHIDTEFVETYIAELARIVDGQLFVTVPNEKGIIFAAKRMAKKMMGHKLQEYSIAEVVNTIIGRTHLVERDGHKGFDYQWLVALIGKYFDVLRVESVPTGKAPLWMAVTVGIVARSRRAS